MEEAKEEGVKKLKYPKKISQIPRHCILLRDRINVTSLVNVFEWKNPKGRTLSPIANKLELLGAFGTSITSMMMMMMLKKKSRSKKRKRIAVTKHSTMVNGFVTSRRVCVCSPFFFFYFRLAFLLFGSNRRLFLYLLPAVKYVASW